jgi:1,4-alpha-glucan branching enzyme
MTPDQTSDAHHGSPSGDGPRPHLVRRAVKVSTFPATLRCHAPDAATVSITGSFDNGQSHPMRRAMDGYWHITLHLKRGRYEYRFLVDGVPTLDPKSFGVVSHPDGTRSSLLEVGY